MKSPALTDQPFVTIIIPIRNESGSVTKSLDAVLMQDYPQDRMEILIADGMSTDNTRSLINEFYTQHPQIRIQILDNPGKIVSMGLNIVLRQSTGEFIIRIDGHTVIEHDYVRQCINALQRTNADNVGGKMNAIGNNPFGRGVALATSIPFGIGGGLFHYSEKEEWVDTVYMGAWPRRVFEKIGLFDEELVRDQDDEYNFRLRKQGGCILLSPAIHSEYTVRSTPFALWRQYFQYGYWKVRVLQKHPRQMSLRQFVPPALVLCLLVSLFFVLFPISYPLPFVAPLLYLIANLIASIHSAYKHGWGYLQSLPPVFAILHLSYGMGFLAGLLKFVNRWSDKQGKTPAFSNDQAVTP